MVVLRLRPEPVTRPWGGTRLARRFGLEGDADGAGAPIGEWWLVSVHAHAPSALADDARDLPTWLAQEGAAHGLPAPDAFPVLVKFLDCDLRLSLQVHPDDDVARAHGLVRGKTEAWHVLDAEPDALVYLGLAEGATTGQLLDRLEAGAPEPEIVALLRRLTVRAGDTLLVPAGTVHAIGGGVTLFEVQQSADVTYRLSDWGRGRATHLAQGRAAALDHPPARILRPPVSDDRATPLIDEAAFGLLRLRVVGTASFAPARGFATLTAIEGAGTARGASGDVPVRAGETLLVTEPVTLRGAPLDLLVVEPPR